MKTHHATSRRNLFFAALKTASFGFTVLVRINAAAPAKPGESHQFDVREFGAKGDGTGNVVETNNLTTRQP